jgi:hypothetical protein
MNISAAAQKLDGHVRILDMPKPADGEAVEIPSIRGPGTEFKEVLSVDISISF